jgi:hypothetical protein
MPLDEGLAELLKDYVPRSEHESILDALSALDEENTALKGQLKEWEGFDRKKTTERLQELEGKVRTRNYQDAWKGVADKLGIDDDFRDDVFDSLRVPMDKDEPDAKGLEKHAREWLEAKESRKKYLKPADEGQGDGKGDGTGQGQGQGAPKGKPRLHTEEEGRGGPVTGPKAFRYRSDNLSDPEWMRVNGVEYSKAMLEGRAQRIA